MLHGKLESIKAEKIAKETFSENSSGSNLPSVKLNKSSLNKNLNIVELIMFSKLESSKSEVRRLIKGKAIKINNQSIDNDKFIIRNELFSKNYLKLSIGKKRHIKIELI